MVALADAGSRIRVALRNPMDQETTPRHSLTLAALFSGSSKAEADTPESGRSVAEQAVWDHPIQLHVRVLEVSDAALAELRAQSTEVTSEGPSDHSWRVAAFRSGEEAAKLIQSLQQKHQLEVVSSERLMAGVGRPISYRAGVKPYQLRVQFSPEWVAQTKLSLRVKPQIAGSNGAGRRSCLTRPAS